LGGSRRSKSARHSPSSLGANKNINQLETGKTEKLFNNYVGNDSANKIDNAESDHISSIQTVNINKKNEQKIHELAASTHLCPFPQ